jgi:hypothetical protein
MKANYRLLLFFTCLLTASAFTKASSQKLRLEGWT